jgi:hypothetical protein
LSWIERSAWSGVGNGLHRSAAVRQIPSHGVEYLRRQYGVAAIGAQELCDRLICGVGLESDRYCGHCETGDEPHSEDSWLHDGLFECDDEIDGL